jgi:hypothetical protein
MKTASERGVTIAAQPVNNRLVFFECSRVSFCITRDQRRSVYQSQGCIIAKTFAWRCPTGGTSTKQLYGLLNRNAADRYR